MSIRGETCSDFGTDSPSGLNKNVTLSAHGVFVTSAIQTTNCSSRS